MTSWIFRFIYNCRSRKLQGQPSSESYLTTEELHKAEVYWYLRAQLTHFPEDIDAIKPKSDLSKSSPLLSLRPFIDSCGLLHVGGQQQYSQMIYSQKHPIILHQVSLDTFDHSMRTPQIITCWSYSSFGFPQSSLPHTRLQKIGPIYYSWMCYLSQTICQTIFSTYGTTSD